MDDNLSYKFSYKSSLFFKSNSNSNSYILKEKIYRMISMTLLLSIHILCTQTQPPPYSLDLEQAIQLPSNLSSLSQLPSS
jgi:hypothetical protein